MRWLFPDLADPAPRAAALPPLALAALAHLGALALLLRLGPAPARDQPAPPLAVRVIEEAPAALPAPPPPKKPLPAKRPLDAPPPLLASRAAHQDAASFAVPPPPPPAAPAAAAVPPAPTLGSDATPPAPAPIVPARFDAAYLDNPKPAYPPISRRLGEEGRVVLRVHVDAEGRAAEVLVRTSSGFPRLDAAAREAVARWRFVPARQGEAAIADWVLVPIVFQLEG